ncbi:MAG: protoheme IX farnesyltransferase, partial [Flavobacterium sp.]|nr:protoheme IX farnesyltransferase [Flavobacterium sp.]
MNATINTFSIKSIFIDFKEITKAGLAVSVLFSSIAGYLLGFSVENPFSWNTFFLLVFG